MVDKFLSSGVFFNHERAADKEPCERGWRRVLPAPSQGRSPLPSRPSLVANTSCSLVVRATKTRVPRDTKAFTPVGRAHEKASRLYSNELLPNVASEAERLTPHSACFAARFARGICFHSRCGCSFRLERLLSDREESRSIFVKSTEGLSVFVSRAARFRDGRTGATPKAGVGADVGGAERRHSLRTRDGGERANRALRDARATGSWLAPQGQLAA